MAKREKYPSKSHLDVNTVPFSSAEEVWWGSTIIQVCQKPYQFSCWNRSDPNLKRIREVTNENIHFVTCLRIARRAVIGVLRDTTNGATHYHADYVSPYWAEEQKPVTKIGRHIFYKLVDI